MTDIDGASEIVERLLFATNAHDIGGIVACFSSAYQNETPAHPLRRFVGSDQVKANWEQILHFVPDLSVTLLRTATDGDTVWSEWEQRGTRLDGSLHAMAGVIIFSTNAGLIDRGSFYLEPVTESAGINESVRDQVAPAREMDR